MKGKGIIILTELQSQALDQLHSNHMGKEKAIHLAKESINSVNMNLDIENTVKIVCHVFGFSRHSKKNR